MRGPVIIRDWLRARPIRADALLAAGVLALIVAAVPAGSPEPDRLGTAWFVLVVPLACVCLVLRRRLPWAVFAATTVLGLVGVVAAQGPTLAYLPSVVALASLSLRVPASRAAGAALLSVVLPVLLILLTRGDGVLVPAAYVMTGWSAIAAFAGVAVRSQRSALAAADERVRVAEATREDEARRRVTEERLRIARELHDVVAHHVSVINVQAGVAGHLVRSDPEAAAEAMAHVRQASQTVLDEVPSLLGLLRSTGDGLETAPAPRLADAEQLVEQARRAGAHVVWRTSGIPRELSPSVDLVAYRVLQEALTNASRHGSGRVDVEVAFTDRDLALVVRNGKGVHLAAAPSGDRHGLTGMRERVLAVGGSMTAGPDESGSWAVEATLPLRLDGAGPGRGHDGVGLERPVAR